MKIKIYKSIILPIVLYGREAWSLTLRDECRLKVFENKILAIFGPKRVANGEWRRLHNEELHNLIKSRKIKMDIPPSCLTIPPWWPFSKTLTWPCLYCMFTYIYSLLIKKDICDCQNISIKLPCVIIYVTKLLLFYYYYSCCSFYY